MLGRREVRFAYLPYRRLVIGKVAAAVGRGVSCGMARKLRLEFPGALYHIINRGNYRQWMFAAASTRAAFEACLFEGCERSGCLLHAFVIMGNHYHLVIETPCAFSFPTSASSAQGSRTTPLPMTESVPRTMPDGSSDNL